MIEAYEMFQQSYIEPRQQKIDDTLTYLFEFISPVRLETINKPPIGVDYVALFTAGLLTQNEARKELGFEEIEKTPVAMSSQNPFGWDDERDLAVFMKYGEPAENFEAMKFDFASAIESAILNVLKENKGLQIGDIVNITKLDPQVVVDTIAKLNDAKLIKGYNQGLEVTPKGLDEISQLQTEIVVRYKYAVAPGISGGMIIPGSRDFCRQIDRSNRVYSRADIDAMSAQTGIDVWSRRGGWYHDPVRDVNVPQCRHIWQQQLLRRIK